ncbi:MAG: hypothetical protein FD157_4012 [Rhodocyclaceae bacterium]|nr:MAG: hypothetical protein FD157_4012 [Rhodocyclaceae bacterium]TNC98496.1 MAG: hypothetical protein FD118_4000 [Rhodocyclaceae bacterium]
MGKAFLLLLPLGTDALAGHRFTAMACGIEERQPLLKAERRIGNRSNDYESTFYRHTNPLINTKMRFPRDCRRQTNTQIVAPLLDIENGHGHNLLRK